MADNIVKRLTEIVYDNERDAEVGFEAAELIQKQAKELVEMWNALDECADYLESEIKTRHGYPYLNREMQMAFNIAMEPVRKAREILIPLGPLST
jgi:hypothetical protein